MASVTYKKNRLPIECDVSEIKLVHGEKSECCDVLFQYEPVSLTLKDYDEQKELLQSNTHALKIETQYQTIWLLGIVDMELQHNCRINVKFEHCILL